MPLDPFLEPLLADLPPLPTHVDDFDAFRAQNQATTDAITSRLAEPGPEVKERREVGIPVDGGTIDLLVYRPFEPGPNPAYLYLHGGGWATGNIHYTAIDGLCRERCVGAGCVVVAVDYRKAPEHKFPTGLDDCHATLRWVHENAGTLGIDPDLIVVGGGSAGGNLTAALMLKVRDEGGPLPVLQLLEAPALDLTLSSPSVQTYGTGYGLDEADIRTYLEWYLRSPADATDPYASPLLAQDLSGLPPAHVMSSEYDPLRDDGERYATRLPEAGVPATFSLQLGHIHSSSMFTAAMESARAWRAEVCDVLRTAHARAGDQSVSSGNDVSRRRTTAP